MAQELCLVDESWPMSHGEFGRNDHREGAPHFTSQGSRQFTLNHIGLLI